MAAPAGAVLLQRPASVSGPKPGQLASGETGPDTSGRIVLGYPVAANHPNHMAARQGPDRTAGFDRDERFGKARRLGQEPRQLCRGEMVQEQVRHYCVAESDRWPAQPIKDICLYHFEPPALGFKALLSLGRYYPVPIYQYGRRSLPG